MADFIEPGVCCVCGGPVEEWSDNSEWGNMERTEDCVKGCGLVHWQHAYGACREEIGFGYQDWSYSDYEGPGAKEKAGYRDGHRNAFVRETRTMWKHPELRSFLRMYVEQGYDYDLRPLRDRITELDMETELIFTVQVLDLRIKEEVARAGH